MLGPISHSIQRGQGVEGFSRDGWTRAGAGLDRRCAHLSSPIEEAREDLWLVRVLHELEEASGVCPALEGPLRKPWRAPGDTERRGRALALASPGLHGDQLGLAGIILKPNNRTIPNALDHLVDYRKRH